MSNLPKVMHQLIRTSPIGGHFSGACIRCNKEHITIRQQQVEECPNINGMTGEDCILAALEQSDE